MNDATEKPGNWWHSIEDGRIQCDLCPRDCKLREGQRGHCFVRMRKGDQMVLTTYGQSSGFCVDPIEKKPLNHFLPGSSVLSFGTAGCNLACRFCQNWDISKSRDVERLSDQASPEAIAGKAKSMGCRSVAFTYNDPVIFAEYALDISKACHEVGLKTVAVTAGYIREEARREFFAGMDAANIDLKAFTEEFYHRVTGAHLEPVLETLKYVKEQTNVWLEITTLLIPGMNDSKDEIQRMSKWIVQNLGPDVPLHFSAFHPDYKMINIPATPASTLQMARETALQEGIHFVYTGNIHDTKGGSTYCPSCKHTVIERDWYEILQYRVTNDGKCSNCGFQIPGVYDHFEKSFGRQRIPVVMRALH